MNRTRCRFSMQRTTWLAVILSTAVSIGCASSSSLGRSGGTVASTSADSTTVHVPVDPNGAPPTVVISAPVHDSRLKGVVKLEAQAFSDVQLTQVRWFIDGAELDVDDDGPPWSANWDTKGASDGPHVILTKAADLGGTWGTSAAVGVWVDNDRLTNVVDTAVTGGPRAANTQTPTFVFESQMPEAVFECRLDDLAALPCSSPLTLPKLEDGAHTLVVTAVAPSGESDPSPAEVSFVVDTSPPAVQVTGPVQAETIDGSIALVAQAVDSSGVTAVRWYANGVDVAYDADGEPWSRPWDTTTVADGRYRIFAKARDTAGNWGTSQSVDVTVSNGAVRSGGTAQQP